MENLGCLGYNRCFASVRIGSASPTVRDVELVADLLTLVAQPVSPNHQEWRAASFLGLRHWDVAGAAAGGGLRAVNAQGISRAWFGGLLCFGQPSPSWKAFNSSFSFDKPVCISLSFGRNGIVSTECRVSAERRETRQDGASRCNPIVMRSSNHHRPPHR